MHIARGDAERLPALDALDEVDEPAREISPVPREQEPSVVDDQLHPDFLAVQEEDRLDAVEARREDEWAARERAAEALDRAAAGNRPQPFEESSRDADAAAAEPVPADPQPVRATAFDLTPFEAEPVRPDAEHDLEFGLE